MPAVSILMPVYNAAPWLGAAVESVRRQTWRDWELLLVDDGSTDETLTVAARYAQGEPRIHLFPRPHQGLVAALNWGLSQASSPWIARMDGDDLMHPRRLEEQLLFAEAHPPLTVIGCLVRCFPRRSLREGMERYERWLNSLLRHEEMVADLFVESPLAHPSVLLRREALEAVGGYQDHGWPEDYDLWMRLWLAGAKFGKVNKVLHFWRDRSDRLTRTNPRYSVRQFRELKIHYLKHSFLAGREAVQLWGAGRGGKEWARHLEQRGIRVVRFVDIDPAKIGRTVRGVPVIAPQELPRHRDVPLLATVGVKGARFLIRARLDRMGWVEGRDYLCVA